MAVKGLTIQFTADTKKLDSKLKGTQGALNKTQNELKAIDRSLKFNPGNVKLLKQKFTELERSVKLTDVKLQQLKNQQKNMDAAGVKKTSAQYKALEREIIKTENQLDRAKGKLKQFGSVGRQQVLAVGNSFKKTGSKISSIGRTITSTMSVFGVGAILAGKKFIAMGEDQTQAENKLIEIYRKRMGVDKEAAKVTFEAASALQEQGVVGDEVSLAFAQQMATYSSMPKTVDSLLPAFSNLLVQQKGLNGTQEDAVGLANLFGKAMMGQTGALKKVGISFDKSQEKILKTGTEEEKAAMLAEVITQNVGEMNSAFAKTDAGKMQQAANTLGDMGEQIGIVLLPAVADLAQQFSEKILPVIQQFIDYLKANPVIADIALKVAAVTAVAGPLLVIIGAIVSAIGTLIGAATAVGGAISAAFGVMLGPIGLVVAAVAGAIAIGVLLYKNWDKVKAFLTKTLNTIKTTFSNIFNGIKNKVTSVFNSIRTKITTAISGVKTTIQNGLSAARDKASKIFSDLKDKLLKPINTAKDKIKEAIDKIKDFFNIKLGFKSIKVPTISINWNAGGNLGKLAKKMGLPGVPNFNVGWKTFASAMQTGRILKGATIFGQDQDGRNLVGGEVGREMIIGRNSATATIAAAVARGFDSAMGTFAQVMNTSAALAAGGNAQPQVIEVYLYKNGPQMGRYIVDTYDTWKGRLG